MPIPRGKYKVHGFGVNDADYMVKPFGPDGKRLYCPFYKTWVAMLERAYSPKCHAKRPTYIGVTVCEEWRSFMAFRAWMMEQDWENKHLDKDIIVPGNKVYSPDTCAFVTREVNNLLTDHAARRGDWPIGVSWHRQRNKFQSRINENKKERSLGLFHSPHEAHLAWRKEKVRIVREAAEKCDDPRVAAGLLRHSVVIESGAMM